MATNDVRISISGLTQLRILFDRLKGGVGSTKLMAEIATFLMANIKLRTAEGKDASGQLFEPYSDKYAMFRRKAGHPTNKVSLFFSGSMMSSMDYKATSTTATLYFLSTQDKKGSSNPDKAYWLNKKREFFALSKEDIREVENMVDEEIDKILRS